MRCTFIRERSMSFGLAPKPPPPIRKWVSLASALTWTLFDHAFELEELIKFGRTKGWTKDYLRERLDNEWEQLADYACDAAVRIRARRRDGIQNVELTTDDLLNFVHVGWERGVVTLDRFPFTFSGGYRQNLSQLRDGFVAPIVWREDLEKYKRISARRRKSPKDSALYVDAEKWLRDALVEQTPRTGLRKGLVERLERRFDLPKYRAQEIYTTVTKALDWPQRGRPRKNTKAKTHNDSTRMGILSDSPE